MTRAPRRAGARQAVRVALWGLLFPAASMAQEPPGLSDAVAYYHQHATSDLPHMQEATARFEAIALTHPVSEDPELGWLPAYWTAFAYSQLSLFARDVRSGPYIDLARIYFEGARGGKPDGEPRIDADFLALEGLLLSFEGRGHPDEQDEYSRRSDEAWNEARRIDPDNPMVWMNEGLGLLPNEERREEAYEVLDRAIELYEERMDSTLPNWGREFIDVWMGSYPRAPGSAPSSTASRNELDLLALDPGKWTVRMDREGAGDRPRLIPSGGGLQVLTGGAAILYPDVEPVSAPYRVELDVSLFDPAGRNEGYGLIFGGTRLTAANIQYGYFLMRRDGMVLVKRRSGDGTAVIRDWVEAPALTTWAGREQGSERATNTLVMEVEGDGVRFLANGDEVHRFRRGELETGGRLGLRVNHGVHIEVTRFRVVGLSP